MSHLESVSPSHYDEHHTSDEDEEDYHTCDEDEDEDEDETSGVPRAASPSSSSSEDGRDPSYYYHTSDDDEDEDLKSPPQTACANRERRRESSAPPTTPHNEDGRKNEEGEEELDVIGAAPVVAVRKETRQLHPRSVTGLEQCVQKMLQSCEQSNNQLVPSGSQQADETLAVASRNGLRDCQNTTLNVQLNLTQQQFGDVTVEKATHINQSFGGSQNISTTATRERTGKEPSRADRIMERTISQFQAWNQGMVRTAALDQVLDKIKSGATWLTIKGNPGEGKTTVGYMALEDLHGCGREVFEVRSPGEFTEVIETCSRPVIMLDDVFGNLEFDQAEWSRWKPAVSPLLQEREHKSHETGDTTSKKDVTVILIGRDYVLNSASVNLGRLSDFLTSEKHVVYMDHTMERSIEEKQAIWETISKSGGVELDRKIVKEILWISVAHGFPHVCRLFTTIYKENKSINAVEFFTKPLTFLNESVSNLFKDTNKLKLCQEMIKGEGKISIRELGKLDRTYKIKQTADTLVGTYIKVEEDKYVFDHPSIYDSVAFQICKLDPEFVIKQCHLSFIYERVRISQDNKSSHDSGLVVYVNKCYADDLAERFAAEIEARNLSYVLSHQAFTDKTFVVLVMERMTKPLQSLLHLTDHNFKSWSFLEFVLSSKSLELLKYIDNCPDITLTADDERNILYWTCMYAASDLLTYLVATRKSFDINVRFLIGKTPLMIAAETRDDQFLHQILSLSPDLKTKDGFMKTIVHYLSAYGLVSSLKRVLESGGDIDVENSFGCSPLHCACENNQLEAMRLLIEKGARVDEFSRDTVVRTGDFHLIKLMFRKKPDLRTSDFVDKCLSVACEGGNTEIMQFLVDKGASVNKSDYFIPLHAASLHNQTLAVQLLLHHGADINSKDNKGDTALHSTTWSGAKDCTELLLKEGATVDVKNEEGLTALENAAKWGYEECVNLLVKAGAELDIQHEGGDTALHLAAGNGNTECVDLLIKAGAKLNIQNKQGDTALCLAGNEECLYLLLTAGATVKKQNKDGNKALHRAAEFGSKQCLTLLLKAGATVDIQHEGGDTALHSAATGMGNTECVDLLLKAGASVNIQNKEGDTALHRASFMGSKDCVDLLLKAGASVNIQNKEGNTALHRASFMGSKDCVDLLLKAGASVNIQNKEGDTALHRASFTGSKDCVDLLLKAGATVDIQNEKGDTALHSAIYPVGYKVPFTSVCQVLIQHGASINTQNTEGDTPLHKLCLTCFPYKDIQVYMDIAGILINKGADVSIYNKQGNTALYGTLEYLLQEKTD